MKSKDDLKTLIQTIKNTTGLTQEKIAVMAGYQPKTLTQILSKGDGIEAVYKQLELVYDGKLNKSTKVDGVAKTNGTDESYRLKFEKNQADMIELLKRHNEQMYNLAMSKEAIVKEINDVNVNLNSARRDQMAYQAGIAANLEVVFERLDELKGEPVGTLSQKAHIARRERIQRIAKGNSVGA